MTQEMEVRYAPDQVRYKQMGTEDLRENFLARNMFTPDEIELIYWHTDRAVVGGAVPAKKTLKLGNPKELVAEYFTERREIGIINIGQKGSIEVDGKDYSMENREALYIGRGSKEIEFSSEDAAAPARFYIVSYPAHTEYPTTHTNPSSAGVLELGSQAESNERTIRQYIHLKGIQSCQLVMGFTQLKEGCVWNTMPPHSHGRRSEIYLYFDVPQDAVVFHLMGEPQEIRQLVAKDGEAALSPGWSIHAGVGTRNYSFVWAMGGENQDYTDMDLVAAVDLK